jgi:hypothetical protein
LNPEMMQRTMLVWLYAKSLSGLYIGSEDPLVLNCKDI